MLGVLGGEEVEGGGPEGFGAGAEVVDYALGEGEGEGGEVGDVGGADGAEPPEGDLGVGEGEGVGAVEDGGGGGEEGGVAGEGGGDGGVVLEGGGLGEGEGEGAEGVGGGDGRGADEGVAEDLETDFLGEVEEVDGLVFDHVVVGVAFGGFDGARLVFDPVDHLVGFGRRYRFTFEKWTGGGWRCLGWR